MSKNERLPRKVKKQLKRNGEWESYLENKRKIKERNENLDIIFTRNYKHSVRMLRRILRG